MCRFVDLMLGWTKKLSPAMPKHIPDFFYNYARSKKLFVNNFTVCTA